MALYDVEILTAPSNTKAIRLICTISGINERDVKTRLQMLPMVITESVQLSEAIEIERQLKRIGITTRVIKVKVDTAESDDEVVYEDQTAKDDEAPEEGESAEEIIEIPEDQVQVLGEPASPDEILKLGRFKFPKDKKYGNVLILFLLIAVLGLISWYIFTQTSSAQEEMEIKLNIELWEGTLQQQDNQLDRGIPAERIFFKLDEIESKLNRLFLAVKRPQKSDELRTKFSAVKRRNRNHIVDLAFRRSLEDTGYPIHPTCLLDRGMVRGSSKLPESTLLRIRLLGEDKPASVFYASRISGGTFKLIIEPAIEKMIYNARATVAPYSQQPEEIQRWAQRRFSLSEIADAYMPKGRRPAIPTITETKASSGKQQAAKVTETPKSIYGGGLVDPGSDPARISEIKINTANWTQTISSSQQHNLSIEAQVLDDIYHRLLAIEVRIDQLLGLLESNAERNIWTQHREEVYGDYIDVRQDIERQYHNLSKSRNPLHLESAIRHNLHNRGLTDSEVLVIDSPQYAEEILIEIEILHGETREILAIIAQAVVEEIQDVKFTIDRVILRRDDERMWWTPHQIRAAVKELDSPNGLEKCTLQLELSASSTSLQ
ncbi:hypothetical protein CEE37_03145 [candidate division LCP-89 bacterium B3_LCP]|uniref:Ribosomal protein L7/L12 C-terminal domain-containing protein n=1 Tax=candidate division LCP-89 bacterium B3_LCP TaxID=2012998 RepID=A0A532V2Y7_UNCL8|nr:MAG: hypothetical protein CEE37_03145 [candidate division LCP-89 bacterium B3_LCP]